MPGLRDRLVPELGPAGLRGERTPVLIHRSSVLGLELVVTTNSYEYLQVVRDIEPAAAGEHLTDGILEVEILAAGDAWTIRSGGRALQSGFRSGAIAAPLQDVITALVCERLPDCTRIEGDLATVSGHCVFIVGTGGETSVLQLALLAQGAELHSGGIVLLQAGSCIPFPRRLRVFEDQQCPPTLGAVPLASRRYSCSRQLFRFFDPTEISRPWRLDRRVPSVIVSIGPSEDPRGETSPARKIEMVQSLLPASSDLSRRPQKTIADVSALVAGCACFRVLSGRSPDALAGVVRQILVAESRHQGVPARHGAQDFLSRGSGGGDCQRQPPQRY